MFKTKINSTLLYRILLVWMSFLKRFKLYSKCKWIETDIHGTSPESSNFKTNQSKEEARSKKSLLGLKILML